MKKEKRKKTVIIRKNDVKQIIAYPEVRKRKETFFGDKFDSIVEKAKVFLFCELSKDRFYTKTFEDTGEMYDWLDDFQKKLEDTESSLFIRLEVEDM